LNIEDQFYKPEELPTDGIKKEMLFKE